jgi:chemotaxis protein histidine kinase CheA
VRPAELAGYSFETNDIIEDMMQAATSRGALPLLSFAATRLWDSRDRNKKLLTAGAYNAMGGVGGAFARHADQIAASVPPNQQILLRAILTRLVTPEGTRAVVDHKELLSLSGEAGAVEQILDQLVRARLIHLHTDPDQVATVEIVHEMLISEWPTLRRWLEEGQAVRGFLHELGQAAKQWETHKRAKDFVWRGAAAQDAISTANRNVLDLSASEADYLSAVRKQASRSRTLRVAVFASIFTALMLVIAGGAVAVVRITAAEHEAQSQAAEAQTQRAEAVKASQAAQAATAKVQAQLDEVKRAQEQERAANLAKQKAEQEQQQAEVEAEHADAKVKLSAEELVRANAQLKSALKTAESNAERAKKDTDEANKAKAVNERLLQEQEARVKQLEDEKKHIYDGDLMHHAGGQ